MLIAMALVSSSLAAEPLSAPQSDDIVVTGERVRRSLRDTASSVAVFGQREIEASGANRVKEMLALVPNVQLGDGSQGPAIRGLDTTGPLQALPAFLGGNRPRTTLIVDGRPVTYNEFVFGAAPAWDIARIEVYRSPQTTTEGVNSIAGAIFVFSEDPEFDGKASARLIDGDYHSGQLSLMATGPLSGDVAVRVAGDLRYSRTTSRITPVMAGADPNHDVFGLLRAKLLVAPAALPGSRALLTLTHSVSQSPQVVGVTAPFSQRRDLAPNYGVFRVRTDSVTTSLRQEFAEGVAGNLLLTAGRSSARRYAFPGFGETRNKGSDWSGEAVLNWKAGPLSGVGGVSHSHVQLRQHIDLSLLSGLTGSFRDWQDGTGLFGEASLKLAARATLTGGLRYQRDRQKRQGALMTNSFSVPADFVGRFSALLPKLSFAYDLSPAWRAGVLLQKAYNPGGTTIRFDTASADTFAAESLWDSELFVRGNVAGGRVLVEANLFNYAMRNAQRAEPIIIFTPTGRGAGFANLFNVPRARSRGLELSIDWRADSRLNVRGSLGLLSSKIVQSGAEMAAYQGKQFDRSPHFTGTLALDWRALRDLRLSAQVRRHSSYFSDNINNPQLLIRGATIASAKAEYQLRRISFFVEATNLFDKLAPVSLFLPTEGQAEDPRRVGAGVEARF